MEQIAMVVSEGMPLNCKEEQQLVVTWSKQGTTHEGVEEKA